MKQPIREEPLRFLTCGSVGDGRSTLLERLLNDNGLEAGPHQGTATDGAYRSFATQRRTFIVADTPGENQHTRNLVTGASNSDAAVILIDASKGVLTQTRHHSHLCSLLGVRHAVLAINKIDLIDYDKARFEEIVQDYLAFAQLLNFQSIGTIPLSARLGDNVTSRSARTPWYSGPTLLRYLEALEVNVETTAKPFRFPVQSVNRAKPNSHGLFGAVASGVVRTGDRVVVAGSGKETTVSRIETSDGDLPEARAGAAVTLMLADDVDAARGDVLALAGSRPEVADQFAAHVIWMNDEPMLPGRSYLMRIGTRDLPARVTALKHKVDVNTLGHLASRTLSLDEVGFCNFSLSAPVAFDAYDENRTTGAFTLVDRLTHATAGAGIIAFALRRATNVHRQSLLIDKRARVAQHAHPSAILWFTGLSGSGKSTIANLVEQELHSRGVNTYMLDGDNIRHGLNRDLGFTDADRVENIRRVGEVAKLFVDAGLVVLCAFISPFRAERRMVRELVGKGEFIEVFVDTPIEECKRRDPKGLYARAMAGKIANFTGVDSSYEPPEQPEITVRTGAQSADECAAQILTLLESYQIR